VVHGNEAAISRSRGVAIKEGKTICYAKLPVDHPCDDPAPRVLPRGHKARPGASIGVDDRKEVPPWSVAFSSCRELHPFLFDVWKEWETISLSAPIIVITGLCFNGVANYSGEETKTRPFFEDCWSGR